MAKDVANELISVSPAYPPLINQPPVIGIFGKSGSGKSVFGYTLFDYSVKSGVYSILVDPKGDAEKLNIKGVKKIMGSSSQALFPINKMLPSELFTILNILSKNKLMDFEEKLLPVIKDAIAASRVNDILDLANYVSEKTSVARDIFINIALNISTQFRLSTRKMPKSVLDGNFIISLKGEKLVMLADSNMKERETIAKVVMVANIASGLMRSGKKINLFIDEVQFTGQYLDETIRAFVNLARSLGGSITLMGQDHLTLSANILNSTYYVAQFRTDIDHPAIQLPTDGFKTGDFVLGIAEPYNNISLRCLPSKAVRKAIGME